MEMRWFETSLGAVPLWARFDDFRPERPAIFVIRGAFSEPTVLHDLADWLPDVDFAFAHLPGMHSPHIVEPSVANFARALQEAAQAAFSRRPINVLGNSIGGLVALSFERPRTILALEPPLLTEGLWPMRAMLQERARGDLALADWIWSIFGVAPDGLILPRDYRGLLERRAAPICVILGGDALEPERPFERLPSLVSREARDALAGRVRLITVAGVGHNIPRDAAKVVYDALRLVAPEPNHATEARQNSG